MDILVGYYFGVLYFKCMLLYSLESPHRGDSNEYTACIYKIKRRKSP